MAYQARVPVRVHFSFIPRRLFRLHRRAQIMMGLPFCCVHCGFGGVAVRERSSARGDRAAGDGRFRQAMMQLRPGGVGLTKAALRVGCVCDCPPHPGALHRESPSLSSYGIFDFSVPLIVNTASSFESRPTHRPNPADRRLLLHHPSRTASLSCFIPVATARLS